MPLPWRDLKNIDEKYKYMLQKLRENKFKLQKLEIKNETGIKFDSKSYLYLS